MSCGNISQFLPMLSTQYNQFIFFDIKCYIHSLSPYTDFEGTITSYKMFIGHSWGARLNI